MKDESARSAFQLASYLLWIGAKSLFIAVCVGIFAVSRHFGPHSPVFLFLVTLILSVISCALVQLMIEKTVSVALFLFFREVRIEPTAGRSEAQALRYVELGKYGLLLNKLEQRPESWEEADTSEWERSFKPLARLLYRDRIRRRIEVIVDAAKKESALHGGFSVLRIPFVLSDKGLDQTNTEEIVLDRFVMGFVEIVALSAILTWLFG